MKRAVSIILAIILAVTSMQLVLFAESVSAHKTQQNFVLDGGSEELHPLADPSVRDESITMSVGETRMLYLNSSKAVNSGGWGCTDYSAIEIISQGTTYCQVKALKETSNVIVYCTYNYIEYVGGFPSLGNGGKNFNISIGGSSGGGSGAVSGSDLVFDLSKTPNPTFSIYSDYKYLPTSGCTVRPEFKTSLSMICSDISSTQSGRNFTVRLINPRLGSATIKFEICRYNSWENITYVYDSRTIKITIKCTHSYTYKSDSSMHWMECKYCRLRNSQSNHTIVYKFDDNGHWAECNDGCGYKSSKVEEHIIGSGVTCEKCDYMLPFKPGDLNGDGIVNINDAIDLLKYIAHLENGIVNEPGTDINGDGIVSIHDAITLLKRIAGLE